MAVNRSFVFDELLRSSGEPFSLKSFIRKIYRAQKTCKTHSLLAGLLAIEQRLKHFHRPLTYFSKTDCSGLIL